MRQILIIVIITKRQLMLIQLISLLALSFSSVSSQKSFAEFEIRKKHTGGDKFQAVGKLNIHILQPYNTLEPELRFYLDQLVSQKDFATTHHLILQIVCIETDMPEYKDRTYLTSVDQISTEAHGQKIAIILGPHSDSIAINAINYVQTRDRVGEVYTEVVETRGKEDELYKYKVASKKSQAQNEGFWAKYKWPLIIGGVLMYTMTAASAKAGGAMAGGQ